MQRAYALFVLFATRLKEYRGSRSDQRERVTTLAATAAAADSRRGRMQGQRGEKKAADSARRG